jgi:hypothetical protein
MFPPGSIMVEIGEERRCTPDDDGVQEDTRDKNCRGESLCEWDITIRVVGSLDPSGDRPQDARIE